MVYEARTGKLYGLNASGWAPTALTADYLLAKGIKQMPQRGIHSVTVPGAVEGWDQLLKRFGTRRLADLLAPAIAYAEQGFPVGEVVDAYWRDSEAVLKEDAATAKTYLPGGHAPAAGDVFRNTDLAWTYRQIAANGRDAFYAGEVAKKILATFTLHVLSRDANAPRHQSKGAASVEGFILLDRRGVKFDRGRRRRRLRGNEAADGAW